ncbi:zinc ribbon domain-containing protein [Klebsiella africana]|uniref:Zinc ribbon domain-containing protein n=1 Tax=Klebsiella africana TaxID=2489010 RepID=A0ACD4ARI1_9ENTR|nr:zinc ribbon domain-containing protein [Klebsiella africana]USB42365.1 zinc ribbon domain-containing protein [Klebsiella africana]
MELDCPLCHAPLDVKGSSAHCAQCERVFVLEARCPECHQPLEVLKACGAVDYFCQHGHGLISKKRVEFIPLV